MTSTDHLTPVWGQAQPTGTPHRSSRIKTIIIAAVAAVVLVGGGVAVASAVKSGSATSSSAGGPGGAMGGPGGSNVGNGGPGGGANGLGGALHGDFVASDGNGGYVTKRLQSGTVTAVSATSITARSADGYSTTFVVGASTSVDNGVDAIGAVKTGDTVTVVGTVAGDTNTAITVFDTTLNQSSNQQNGNPPNQNGFNPNGAGQ
jgi:hypothetical protein